MRVWSYVCISVCVSGCVKPALVYFLLESLSFNLFSFLCLLLPDLAVNSHLSIVLLLRRLTVRTAEAIPQGKVLTVVVVEVQVVDTVVRRGVDDSGTGNIVT